MIRKLLLKNSLWHKYMKPNIGFGHKHEYPGINATTKQIEVPDTDILDDKVIYEAEYEFTAEKIDELLKYLAAIAIAIIISTIIAFILMK